MCVEFGTLLRDVISEMQTRRRASALICQRDRIVGILTERDVVRLLAAHADLQVPVEEVMTRSPATVTGQTTVANAIELMSRGGYRRLPIVDDHQKPIGMLKVSHVLHYLVQHFPRIVYNLPPRPHVKTQEREGA